MTLMYPLELRDNQNDYIQFVSFPYEMNSELNKSNFAPSSGGSSPIVLYMPNTTPATHYGHEATYQTFPGPLGNFGKQFLKTIGSDYSGNDGKSGAQAFKDAVGNFDPNQHNYGGAAYQFLLKQAAGMFGADASTALAMGQGKIYNPNAEMIYKQPYHRRFDFTFDFTPKSREEATMVDKIIYEFKKWSAPKFDGDAKSGFMHIPHLWRVTYHEGSGRPYRRMNLFKPAMMTSFVVQDNQAQDFHMTIQDEAMGHVPVHTTIKMHLQETMPPTREDHDTAVSMGHTRGL